MSEASPPACLHASVSFASACLCPSNLKQQLDIFLFSLAERKKALLLGSNKKKKNRKKRAPACRNLELDVVPLDAHCSHDRSQAARFCYRV
jgi:hypothetical protein